MPSSARELRLQFLPVLSVAMVVVTIGAAFGELSGRGALIGMFSAAVMTLITALIGGSRYGISSPTGPMTAAIAVILMMNNDWIATHYSNIDPLLLMNVTVLVAGVLLFILALLKVHRLIVLVPQLAISGFVNGIAVIIFLSQVQSTTGSMNWVVLTITFLLSLFASRYCNHRSHLVWKIMVSSFGVIILMTLFSQLFALDVQYLNFQESLSWEAFALPSLSIINWESFGIVFLLAFELALIALLDTLLTSVIIDKKSGTKTQHLRELTGQGFSFLGVSLFGGIPGAQSTVPSMMMHEEGNHHRFSKKLLAFFCILLAVVFADLLQYIPSAVFGGIIIKIAVDVADFTSFRFLLQSAGKKKFAQFFLVVAVLLSTVLISLNLAVIGCTVFFLLWNTFMPHAWRIPDLVPEKQSEGLSDEI